MRTGVDEDQAYEKVVDVGMLRCKINDVPISHPFRDNAKRK